MIVLCNILVSQKALLTALVTEGKAHEQYHDRETEAANSNLDIIYFILQQDVFSRTSFC